MGMEGVFSQSVGPSSLLSVLSAHAYVTVQINSARVRVWEYDCELYMIVNVIVLMCDCRCVNRVKCTKVKRVMTMYAVYNVGVQKCD